ncbi:hypothetical protein Cfor_08805 [Coptotermes formosanus]|uniref:Histone-lysine N-methyltransferase SETMAR n=1 Tax=Coptotermes formosanus TaxID=36987 RepID=A0A6L2QA62_COPFO|nr:hypothetical protein Cfor_08805 [Coptotermes formosanus]
MAALLRQLGWESHKHPLYSPALAPKNFHLFSPLKRHLSGHRFQNVAAMQEAVLQWFH